MGRHRSGASTDGERSDAISDDDDADDAWEEAVIASSIRRSRLRKMPKSQQRYGVRPCSLHKTESHFISFFSLPRSRLIEELNDKGQQV